MFKPIRPQFFIPALLAFLLSALAFLPSRAWAQNETEPNNKAGQATKLTLDAEIKGLINEESDEDWYVLTIPAPGLDILVIEVSSKAGLDLQLTLLDAGEKELVEADNKRDGEGEIIVRMKPRPAKYFVYVRATDISNIEIPYTLRAGKPTAPPASMAEVTQALVKALDFLSSEQKEEGYFDEEHSGKTGLALMAFLGGKCTGKDYSRQIRSGFRFLESQFSTDPLFETDSQSGPKSGWSGTEDAMYSHAIATLALIEALAEGGEAKLKPMAEEAVRLIIQAQNTENKHEGMGGPTEPDSDHYGGWRYNPTALDSDISVTGWQILALRGAKNTGFDVPDRSFEAAAKYIKSLYIEDEHSFGYTGPAGESCARAGMGSLGLQLCGYPKDPCVEPALRFMQDHAPTWNLENPGDGYPFYYWYYGSRAMLIAGGDYWRIWKEWTCRMLVDSQNGDGSWEGDQDEDDLGKVYTTALGAMILEFCCGYRPVYMPQEEKKPEPASVQVLLEKEAAKETAKNVELILDASNSMWGQIGGEAKITIARKVLGQIINGLPDSMNVGLRVYGHRYGLNDQRACTDTELLVPIGPIAKDTLIQTINGIQLKGKTPLVLSVLEAIKDFEKIPNGSIILVTDGIESCNGDIQAIAPAIKKSGLELKVNIVGFDIKEAAARQELEAIAKSTEGVYLDAKNASELLSALEQTLRIEFVLLDDKGGKKGSGIVGGEAVQLPPGNYTLRLAVEPAPLEMKLALEAGKDVVLVLKRTDGKWTLEKR